MLKEFGTISIALLGLSALGGAANAHSRCDGDFELIYGSWVATRHCQIKAAEAVSHGRWHISARPSAANEMTPDEYCRMYGASIETRPYCSSYNAD